MLDKIYKTAMLLAVGFLLLYTYSIHDLISFEQKNTDMQINGLKREIQILREKIDE